MTVSISSQNRDDPGSLFVLDKEFSSHLCVSSTVSKQSFKTTKYNVSLNSRKWMFSTVTETCCREDGHWEVSWLS